MDLFYGKIESGEIFINEEDQRHISKVLRMKEGEMIEVTDGFGNVAQGSIYFVGKKVLLDRPKIRIEKRKLQSPIHIAIAPTKNIDRAEFFVEKATELGVDKITFLLTENSERKNLNMERIEKKAIAACKQSQRYFFPTLQNLSKLSDFLKTIQPEKTFVAHCDSEFERISINDLKLESDFTFLIGPEGDFSKHEIKYLQNLKITAVTLGPQRLRTETAGILVAAFGYLQQF